MLSFGRVLKRLSSRAANGKAGREHFSFEKLEYLTEAF
jgi:hypothetical protein